jgi:hypothetical protein
MKRLDFLIKYLMKLHDNSYYLLLTRYCLFCISIHKVLAPSPNGLQRSFEYLWRIY